VHVYQYVHVLHHVMIMIYLKNEIKCKFGTKKNLGQLRQCPKIWDSVTSLAEEDAMQAALVRDCLRGAEPIERDWMQRVTGPVGVSKKTNIMQATAFTSQVDAEHYPGNSNPAAHRPNTN
jgi:hypothetical protein